MPAKTKSSTAARSKAKSPPARPARGAGASKPKATSAMKKPAAKAARSVKRAPVSAAKTRAPAKAAAAKPPARPAKTASPAVRASAASHSKSAGSTATAARTPAPAKAPRKDSGRSLGRQVVGIAPYEETRGEEYMGEPQREHFRRILLQWKRELMDEVDRTVHHMQDEAANFPDPNDRATQESEFSLELRARDRERKLIKKIDEALASVSSGDYGYCESCGVEIGIRRLEARPTATLCIDCKTLDEIREKQTGS
jgi:DnaK suppressor protein